MVDSLGDYVAALRMRDLLQKLVKTEIDTQRPALQYATVDSIDRPNRKCGVIFPGSTGPVKVNMGAVQPQSVGQVVRIDGLLGDRFISDVMGPVYMASPTLSSPTVDAFNGPVIAPAGDISMGDLGSTATRVFRIKRKASSGTNTYETRQYQGDSSTTSNFAIQLRENDIEVNRLELTPDGRGILGPSGGVRSDLATVSYTDGLVKTSAIVGAVDLNTYMTPGTYSQALTADAIAGMNYPAPATAGILEVDAGATGDYVYQRYIPYGPYGNTIFVRTRYNGTWYAWSSSTAAAYAIQFGTGTVNTGVSTALGFASTPLSPANGYTRATNRITVPSAGTYSLSYRYRFVNGTTGTTRAFVELTLASLSSHTYQIPNDTGFIARGYCGQNEDAGEVGVSAVALQAGAQIGGNAYQSSGAARQIDGVLTIQRTG